MVVALAAPGIAAGADETVTLALDRARVAYGGTVVASGTVAPVVEGSSVVIERMNALGEWEALGTAATDATGAFTASLVAAGRGPVRARLESSGALSPEQPLSVVPKVEVNRPRGKAFLGARLVAYVAPLAYEERVLVRVRKYGRIVGRVSGRVNDGVLRVRVPTPGIGRFSLRLSFPASGDVDAVNVFTRARASAR
ncbi:MAG TPA: hypothetical protein VJ717_08525, partial [Gemmatimonadaceae bacterium]|nr:hypothetical protein [Gemmatimonadaceae bacterium]